MQALIQRIEAPISATEWTGEFKGIVRSFLRVDQAQERIIADALKYAKDVKNEEEKEPLEDSLSACGTSKAELALGCSIKTV